MNLHSGNGLALVPQITEDKSLVSFILRRILTSWLNEVIVFSPSFYNDPLYIVHLIIYSSRKLRIEIGDSFSTAAYICSERVFHWSCRTNNKIQLAVGKRSKWVLLAWRIPHSYTNFLKFLLKNSCHLFSVAI